LIFDHHIKYFLKSNLADRIYFFVKSMIKMKINGYYDVP